MGQIRDDRARVDVEVCDFLRDGANDEAVTRALETYGSEILGYLVAATRDPDLGEEAFAVFAEQVWKGLARFEWRCRLRTWLYVVARSSLRAAKRSRERHRREVKISTSHWMRFAHHPRTTRPSAQAREHRCLEALRERLEETERELLILRLDRKMSWNEAAMILAPDEPRPRAAARLRKQYQRTKNRMQRIVEIEGYLSDSGPSASPC